MIEYIKISGFSGVSAKLDGTFTVDFVGLPTRQLTQEEFNTAKRLQLKDQIDLLTSEKIAAIFGYTEKSIDLVIKQLNINSRADYIKNEAVTRTLTDAEVAELALYSGYFARITALRVYGKTLAASLATADPTTFDINAGWPE